MVFFVMLSNVVFIDVFWFIDVEVLIMKINIIMFLVEFLYIDLWV